MNLSDLLAQNNIKEISPDTVQAKECITGAEEDIGFAKESVDKNADWALSIAYNAMLRAIRALMFADGYSPAGEGHHKTAVDYAEVKFGAKHQKIILAFDRLRKKRHHAVYDKTGTVSTFEATNAIRDAEKLLGLVRGKIKL